MKIIVAVLILCFSVNSISAWGWFGFRSDEKPKQITTSPTTHRQVTHLQRSVLPQKNRSVNSTNSPRQADSINKKSSSIIYQNRFQGIAYPQQHRALDIPAPFGRGNHLNRIASDRMIHPKSDHLVSPTNSQQQADNVNKKNSPVIQQNRVQDNPATSRQDNRVSSLANNRIFQQKLDRFLPTNRNNQAVVTSTKQRVLSQTSLSKSVMADSKPNNVSIIKNNTQPNQPRSILAKSVLLSKKTGLRGAFTTKLNNNNGNQNRQRILSDYYGQQQWKPFYLRPNSNLYSALKRRRRNAQNDKQSIIFTRELSSSDDIY